MQEEIDAASVITKIHTIQTVHTYIIYIPVRGMVAIITIYITGNGGYYYFLIYFTSGVYIELTDVIL
jgi:hypothetical protein